MLRRKKSRRFRGRRRKGETFNDQKMETNAMSNSQPKSLGIPHHTKTIITLGGGIMTYTSYRNSKP